MEHVNIDSILTKRIILSGEQFHRPLIIAIKNNNFDIVKILIDSKADVNTSFYTYSKTVIYTPLRYAIKHASVDIVKYLIENGADDTPFYNGECQRNARRIDTLVCIAVRCEKTEILKFLVERGEDVNAHAEYCDTPLSIACQNKNLYMVKYLIRNGASTGASNKHNNQEYYYTDVMTPLLYILQEKKR